MDRTSQFLDYYGKLEKIARTEYDIPEDKGFIPALAEMPPFRSIRRELNYCREVRNLLDHNGRVKNEFPVEVSQGMLDLIQETIQKIQHPLRVRDIMIPASQVFSCKTDDLVLPAIIEMQQKVFTHVPIMEKGIVAGVFSENTLLCKIVDDEIIGIDRSTRFSEFEKYLPMDRHSSESFRFVPESMLKTDLESIFSKATAQSDRIGMVFVTAHGKSTERLLGIVTAWDLPEA